LCVGRGLETLARARPGASPAWPKDGINGMARGAGGRLAPARCAQCREPLVWEWSRQVYLCPKCGYKVSYEDRLRGLG